MTYQSDKIIIHSLANTTSTIEKQRILQTATEEEKKIFQFAYNPFKLYYQKFEYIRLSTIEGYTNEMFTILDRISNGSLRGHDALYEIEDYSRKHGDLIKMICNKDLKCGVSATTLNKVFGKGFIPQFKIQKAIEKPLSKIDFPILAQIKYNGARVVAFIYNHKVVLKSSGGKVFSYPALEKELANIEAGTVLDGELCIGDSKNTNHTTVSGSINSSARGNPIQGKPYKFYVFDCMTTREFGANKCNKGYAHRQANLYNALACKDITLVQRARTNMMHNKEQVQKLFQELTAEGYEGLILKGPDHLYTFKKNATWIKMKLIKDEDLLCIDYEEGCGKYKGQIGALVCAGQVEGREVRVELGSGLSDKERAMDPQYFIGKMIELRYNEVIKDNKNNTWGLFLARFVQVREDKS